MSGPAVTELDVSTLAKFSEKCKYCELPHDEIVSVFLTMPSLLVQASPEHPVLEHASTSIQNHR
jgi:hypothetical protein